MLWDSLVQLPRKWGGPGRTMGRAGRRVAQGVDFRALQLIPFI